MDGETAWPLLLPISALPPDRSVLACSVWDACFEWHFVQSRISAQVCSVHAAVCACSAPASRGVRMQQCNPRPPRTLTHWMLTSQNSEDRPSSLARSPALSLAFTRACRHACPCVCTCLSLAVHPASRLHHILAIPHTISFPHSSHPIFTCISSETAASFPTSGCAATGLPFHGQHRCET